MKKSVGQSSAEDGATKMLFQGEDISWWGLLHFLKGRLHNSCSVFSSKRKTTRRGLLCVKKKTE